MDTKQNVCVDLDGCLCEYKGWDGIYKIGKPYDGAVEFTKRLQENYHVMVYTTRCDPNHYYLEKDALTALELKEIVKIHLDMCGFHYDEIYTGKCKPWARAYIDDRAVECNAQKTMNAGVSTRYLYEMALESVHKMH